MEKVTGIVTGVNGNLITAEFDGSVKKNEVCYVCVGDERLKGEVIRITNGVASMQVYEMTNGVQVGDRVELSGELLSVELGPGLLSQVYGRPPESPAGAGRSVRLLPPAGRLPGPHPRQVLGVHPGGKGRRRGPGRRHPGHRARGPLYPPYHGPLRLQGRGLDRPIQFSPRVPTTSGPPWPCWRTARAKSKS